MENLPANTRYVTTEEQQRLIDGDNWKGLETLWLAPRIAKRDSWVKVWAVKRVAFHLHCCEVLEDGINWDRKLVIDVEDLRTHIPGVRVPE